MLLRSWLHSMVPGRVRARRSPLRKRFSQNPLAYQPALELLETRTLLAAQLVLSGFAQAVTAGVAGSITVTAQNSDGTTDTAYTGIVHFKSSDAQAILPGDTTLTNGVGTFNVTLKTAGTQTVTATDTVTPSITGTLLGNPQIVSVYSQAPDPAGGVIKSAWYPPDGLDGDAYAFDSFVLGSTQSISGIQWRGGYTNFLSGAGESPVSDFTISIYASIPAGIQPDLGYLHTGPLARYSVGGNAGETLAGTVGGIPLYDYKYTLPTAFQAVAGTKYWIQIEASQGVTPFYGWPPDWGIANGIGGDGSHFYAITGGTNGGGTLYFTTAHDTAFTLLASVNSPGVVVNPAATSQFAVSGMTSPTTAGAAGNITVTAEDAFGNLTAGYTGTVHFTSSDAQAPLPADATLTNGSGAFSITLETAGAQSITVTDTVASGITGTQSGIVVNPAAASSFALSSLASPATLGAAESFTVTALDPYGNTATGYTGTVHFTSSDSLAVLPADGALSKGTGAFSATLMAVGNQTITATDTVDTTITGTGSVSVVVAPPLVTAPASQSASEGTSLSLNLGSFSDPAAGPWSVDVNWGDGTTDSIFTALTPGSLGALNHLYGEEGIKTVTVLITNTSDNKSSSSTFQVSVADPAVAATGGFVVSAVRGAPLMGVTVATFTDPGAPEPNTSDSTGTHYSAQIAWGDGTTSTGTITFNSATKVFTVTGDHIYTTTGSYAIAVAVNHESAPAASVTSSGKVSSVAIGQGPSDSNTLLVGGTLNGDTISVTAQGTAGAVAVSINRVSQGVFAAGTFSSIAVYGQAGNDTIQIDSKITRAAYLFGGSGNDTLKAGGGNSLLAGGVGSDKLTGGSGRDILIGGAGADTLTASSGAALLIAGSTDFEDPSTYASNQKLANLLTTWSAGTSASAQVATVSTMLASHVFNDGAADTLTAGTGMDAFFVSTGDAVKNKQTGDVVVTI